MVSGLEVKDGLFLLGAVPESLSLLAVYLLARLVGDRVIAYLSAAVAGFAVWNIRWGFWIIAMTVTVLFFALAVYLFIRIIVRRRNQLPSFGVLLLLIGATLVSHPTPSIILEATLTLIAVTFAVLGVMGLGESHLTRVRYSGLAVGWVLLLGYWLYVSGTFSVFIAFLGNAATFDQGLAGSVSIAGNRLLLGAIWDRLPFYLLEFLGTVGVLTCLVRPRRPIILSLGVVGGIFLVASLLLTVSDLPAGLGNRFTVFAELLLAVPTALGVVSLASSFGAPRNQHVAILVAAVLLTAIPLLNYQTSAIELVPVSGYAPSEITWSEASATNTILSHSGTSMLRTDQVLQSYLRWDKGLVSSPLGAPDSRDGAFSIIRTSQMPIYQVRQAYDSLDSSFAVARFFDSGSVVAFVAGA